MAEDGVPGASGAGASGAGTSGGARERLGGEAVADRLGRLDETLGRLEQTPGATAETALDAVTMLAELYGEALARVLDRAAAAPGLVRALMDDDLVGHLLILHDVHPEPVERRVARALERLGPVLSGAGAELAGVEGGTARVLMSGGCGCGGGAAAIEEAVRDAVLAAAPEISEVEQVGAGSAERPAAFIPVDALFRRPTPDAAAATAGGAR